MEQLPNRAEFSIRFFQELYRAKPRLIVTPAVVLANAAVFMVMALSGAGLLSPSTAELIRWGANYGPLSMGDAPWRLLSSCFVHVGLMHILFNMLVLSDAGRLVERLYGSVAFLLLYLVAGISGSMLSVYAHPAIVSAGASGAVFGVYGALIAFFLKNRRLLHREIIRRSLSTAFFFVGVNLVFGFAVPGIDNSAHVGGLLGGFCAGCLLAEPAGRASAARRGARIAVTAGLAIVVLMQFWQALPHYYADYYAVRVSVVSNDRQVREAFGRLSEEFNAGSISADAMAAGLEDECLNGWEVMVLRLENVTVPAGSPLREHYELVLDYARLRRDAYRNLVEAFHGSQPSRVEDFYRLHERGDAVLEQIDKKYKGLP